MRTEKILGHLGYWRVTQDQSGGWCSDAEAPAWFQRHFRDLQSLRDQPTESPLGSFLEFVEKLWNPNSSPVTKSDVWWEDGTHESVPFRAEASIVAGERVLLVQRLGDDFRAQHRYIQSAREQVLTSEQLELEVQRRTKAIRERETELSVRLINAACARDEETGAHIRRLGLYSSAMARLLGWSPQSCSDIEAAAPLHDIGKIAIPDRVLRKPGKLTEPEREIMMTHAQLGAELLEDSDIPMLRMAADIARSHHERWDGAGYPNGLAGAMIPEAARIVAIADVYDALVHERVYKEAIPELEALHMMQNNTGHFDQRLLTLFIDNIDAMRAIREMNPDESSLPENADSLPDLAARG